MSIKEWAFIREVGEVLEGNDRFVPAPQGCDRTAGMLVEVTSEARGDDLPGTVEASASGLMLKAHGKQVNVCGKLQNGWLHEKNSGNLNMMFEAQDGDYAFYSNESTVARVCRNEACTVYRVRTPLVNEKSIALYDAIAYTDVYLWNANPMATLLTYFDAKCYTVFSQIEIAKVRSNDQDVRVYSNGAWQTCAEEGVVSNAGGFSCQDLRDFDASHPFVTHIVLGKESVPPVFVRDVRPCKECISVESGDLKVMLERSQGGVVLKGIDDAGAGTLLTCGSGYALFNLLLRDVETAEDREYMISSNAGWEEVSLSRHGENYELRFDRPHNPALSGVTVILEAVINAKASRIAWEANIRVNNTSLTVVRFDPPILHTNAGDDTQLFIALGPGQARPFGRDQEIHILSPYPSIGVCMQYMALWSDRTRRGIYYGIHDPSGSYKMIMAQTHHDICTLGTMVPARGIGEPANSYRMDGQLVWQLFDGDWYDATMIYRDWVFTCASWFKKIPASQRKDVPEWMLTAPLWFVDSMDPELDWLENLIEAQEDINLPTALHIYQWHEIPFDTNYPHYYPAKKEFLYKLPIMQARGIKVMTYINGRLWDTHDRGDYDYQFSTVAKPYVTKGRNGEPITESYNSKNSKGEKIELGVMCPSTALWQEKQSEITNWLINEIGVDAVYIDQIAAAPPVNCMDASHAHRLGGGSWWYEHYYNLIDHARLRLPANKCYSTESNAEIFVGHIAAMLVWHWTGDWQVPAFSAVYAGYQPMFGRNYSEHKDSTEAFRIMTAQSLCFGDQIGWIGAEHYLSSPYREYFKQAARLRYQYGEYFYAGRCLRPPCLEGDLGAFTKPFHSPGVLSALWEKHDGEARLVVLTNMTDQTREVTAYLESGEKIHAVLPPASSMIYEL